MAFGGDTSQWLGSFPEEFIPDVIQVILDGWQMIRPVERDAKEVPINLKLCTVMRKIKSFRALPFAIRPESFLINLESGKQVGRIDLLFTHGDNEDLYLSFECKRLYYSTAQGKIAPDVHKYSGDGGMMCYITEQYSPGLPHGGMIGYVLNGSVSKARAAIEKRIDGQRGELRLATPEPLLDCSYFPGDQRLAESTHDINGRAMTIFHILLAN